MAKTSTQIEIPVSLKASLEGLKEVKTQVSQALDKAGKNTTLGKTLSKELSTVAAKFGEIDEILLSPTIDESGLKRLERLADQISSHFAQSFAKIDFSSFEQFATEDQLTRMRELQELTRKQRRELEAINKHGSQERTDTYLMRTDNEVALNHMRNYKGFDATQTLSKNQQAMERLSQSHERTLADMKKQLEEYDQKASESFNAWDAADKRVKVLEPQVATLRKDSYAATFYDKIGRMNTRISANPETVNPKISSIEKELGSALRSIEAGGVIATEARDALKDWITHTFTNISSTEASQMVGMTVNKLLEKLMEKIFGQGYEADREGGYDFSHSALLARGQDFADDSVKRLNAKHSTGSASDLALVSQQKIKELREAKIEATAQENAAEHYMDLGMALEAQIAETQQAANHTRFLAQELGRYAEVAKRAAQASKQSEINDSEQAQRDYATQAKQEQKNIYDPLKQAHGNAKSNVDAGLKKAGDSWAVADAAAAEAEDFKKHLKQSIAHWASAQQIINVVKDGIRQAYQDIKALDSAMTNIAVVTDMSIGDLWGKINEYMSIAKQYGVTTQGVYEVSQLYYQQGLSTSEVMAATTETLKMARIAGMDYAEAADAMTVAIRAFKMDMTDAGHVTDVYSKVAAVTASDSEELAIAMSKTASSAESVGSSFENTTSMLAVMIETTRESAQNLGSALKSIISRYGEMKVGLTVDSEGEEIDYNKVDTALKSVGISIKDAQGQFRDFDDVIFELSEKWDGLDKNTQRYIATIMAGNRQQSRFIALVDNWERLEEVSAAAADSADAGLLQYAKTMDSLDTKINNLKTSFQQFYMSIFDGEFFKGFIDIINNAVETLSRMGPILGTINLLQLINQIKLVGQLLVNAFSSGFTKISQAKKDWENKFTSTFDATSKKAGDSLLNKFLNHVFPSLKSEGAKAGSDIGENLSNGITESITAASQQWLSKIQEFANQAKVTIQTITSAMTADSSTPAGLMLKNQQHLISNKQFNTQASSIFGKYASLVQTGSNKKNSRYKALSDEDKFIADKLRESQGDLNYSSFQSRLAKATPEQQTAIYQEFFTKLIAAAEEFKRTVTESGEQAKQNMEEGAENAGNIELQDALLEGIQEEADAKEEDEIEKQDAREEGEIEEQDSSSNTMQKIGAGLTTAGTVLTSAGMMWDQSTMAGYDTSTGLQAAGSIATVAGQALTGNYVGAAIGAITGIVTVIQRVSQRAQVELENAKKAAENANIERAQKKEEYQSLESYTKRLEELNETRFESNEAQEEWLALNNEMAEKYPELISYIDSEGNAIVDLSASYDKLATSREAALKANQDYWTAQKDYEQKQLNSIGSRTYGKTNVLAVQPDSLPEGAYLTEESTQYGSYQVTLQDGRTGTAVISDTIDGRQYLFTPDGSETVEYITSSNENYNVIKEQTGISAANQQEFGDEYQVSDIYRSFFKDPDAFKTNDEAYAAYSKVFENGGTITDLVYSDINLANMITAMNDPANAEWAQGMEQTGLFTKNADDSYELSDLGKQVGIWQENSIAYRKSVEGFISSTGNLILYGTDSLETISEISGWEELALIDATSTYKRDHGGHWLEMSADQAESSYEDFAKTLAEWYSSLSENYQKTFNNILNNIDAYSPEELQKELNKIGLFEGMAVYDAIILKSAESRAATVERWARINATDNNPFVSFEQYRADKTHLTDEQAAKAYNETYGIGADKLSTQELDAYIDRHYQLAEQVAANSPLKGIFENQNTLLKNALAIWQDSDLSDEASRELYEIINAEDFGSVDWSKRVQEWNAKWGTTYGTIIDESANIISESFFTYVDGVLDEVDSTLDSFKDITEKQAKGFTFDEAKDLLRRYQQLEGHANATFNEVFDVLEDGTIVLKNLDEVTSEFYAQQARDMEEASGKAQESIDAINNADWTDKIEIKDFAKYSESGQIAILRGAGVDDTMIPAIIAGIANGSIKTWEDVVAFLERTKKEVDAGADYYNKQTQAAVNESAWNKWYDNKTTAEKSPLATTESLDNYKDVLIQRATKRAMDSRDANDQGPVDISDALDREYALMETYGATIDEAGNIIWKSQVGRVNYLLHTSQITIDEAENLLEYAKLTDSATKAEATDTFINATKKFIDALREGEDGLAAATKDFVDSILPDDASDEVRDAVTESVMNLGPNATDAQIREAILNAGKAAGIENISETEINAYLTDSANERTKRFFELYGKWLAGTITETELLELQDMDIPDKIASSFKADFSAEAAGTVEQYYEYLGAAIKEGNEEIIKSARDAAKEATTKELNQIAAGEGNDIETFQLAGQIDGANGKYSTDMLATLGAETGEFNKEAFQQYFHWDEESQSWLLDAGENMRDALVDIYGKEVPAYIVDAFEASELEERIAKAIEHDNNLTSIPEKFASLISDPLNASLEDLIEFWESLLGRDLTTDEYNQVYEARQKALDGNTELLEGMFGEWNRLAISKGYDVRWGTIKQATFGKQNKNQADVEKWLNGEGTVDDLGQFWIDQYDETDTTDTLEQFITKKIGSMRGAFIDTAGNLIITDYEEFMGYLAQEGLVDEATLTQYAAEIQDTTLKTIKSIFDYINKAIEGTLTATELRDMGKAVVNSGTMSADEWQTFASQNVSRVGNGYKMNEAAAFALQVNTGNYDFEDLVNQFDNLDEVNEMLRELQENSAEWGDEFVRAAERVLESIRLIKAQDPKDAMFNWMNQDMEGWAGTYESTMGSISKANDVINASMESGTMGLNDFYNMSHIVASQLKGDELTAWNNYRDAVYATATTVDGGTVSLTNSHMTMEEALGQMTKSTESYYQDIARQQIEFIDKQIAALEAQKKVEEALKGDSGNSNAALNREDLVYTGIAGDIGLYSEEEYAAAEKKWFKRGGPQYVGGEEQNTSESFAATVSKYIGEATQDALKAGLDITDAQVQQQIKDSAMARAGIDGYYDTLQNEELKALTTISQNVAAIKEAVAADEVTTPEENPPPPPPPPKNNGGAAPGLASNSPDFQENAVAYDDYDSRLTSNDEKTVTLLEQAQKETIKQTGIQNDMKTNISGIEVNVAKIDAALTTTNQILGQVEINTRKEADTSDSGKDDTTGSGEKETTTGIEQPPIITQRLEGKSYAAAAMGDTEPIFIAPTPEKRGTTTNAEGLNQDKPDDDSQQSQTGSKNGNVAARPTFQSAIMPSNDFDSSILFKSSGTEEYDNGTLDVNTSQEHLNELRQKHLAERYAQIDQETNTGLGDSTGSGNDTANLKDPRIVTTTTQQFEGKPFSAVAMGRTGEIFDTSGPVEQYIDSLNISDSQKQFYKDWYHDRDREDGTNGYDTDLQNGTYPHVRTIMAEMDTAAKTISMRNQLSGEEGFDWLPQYSTEEMQDWYLHGLPAFEATIPYPMWMWHEDPGDSLSKYTQYDAIPGINDNDRFLWGDSFSRLGQYGSGGFPEHHWARNLNIGPIAGNTDLDYYNKKGSALLDLFEQGETPVDEFRAWYKFMRGPEMGAYQSAYDNNLLASGDRELYERVLAIDKALQHSGASEEGYNGGIAIGDKPAVAETAKSRIPYLLHQEIAGDFRQFIQDTQEFIDAFAQIGEEYIGPALSEMALGLQAAGNEIISRIMGEDPVLTESEIEAKAVADAVLGALDNLDNYNDNDELNYAAAIIEVSKTLQKLPEEWIPLLQKALGPDGTAKTYLSAGDVYKLQTDFTPMATFDTTTIKEDIQNAIIEAQEEAQAEMEDNPSNMPVDANIEQAQQKINQLVNKVKNTSPSVNVKVGFTYGGAVSGDLGGNGMANAVAYDLASRFGFATGNVNGLAFATGTEKLIAGANLANKALVGELGPELAVYNGQYHLLGANGAEFANIPSNAIIFNHKQTEGILKGQANIRGRVKDGGEAFAEGNVSGAAYGTGNIDEAIKALQEARAMWQSLLDRDLGQLAGISSNKGGGGGSVAKAYSTELQEWYNLLRQIADIEAEINQLVAERTNLQNEYNGEAVVRNLRQQQMLLNQQLKTQETLLVYQNAQLKRQAKEINKDEILSQFIEVNEDGIVQYLKGNEAFGGKGTLEVLSWLNDASSKEQLAFIKQIGFDKTKEAYDQNGKMLKDDKLVQAFFDYFDTAIKEYDGLQDTVDQSTTKLETINTNITKLSDEIRDNQMKLEQNVFDTIVDAWEANIDALEEQKELIEEANDAYTEGLREALEAERKTYEDEASMANREQLQRELSLLRRSGGSASEIADLEEQIDNALKDEYFKSQEDMIADIEEANKNQIELLEKQIKIEEETLEYQKENGIIWQKVAEILSGTKDSIMEFFRGNNEGFFSKSKEQQIDALNEWSYSVGMYKEDQLIKSQAMDFANGIVGEDANGKGGTNVWETEQLKGYKSLYDTLDDNQKQAVHDAYGTAYQQAISEGESKDKARAAGYNAVAKQMGNYQAERDAIKSTEDNNNNPDTPSTPTPTDDEYVYVTISSGNYIGIQGKPTINGRTEAKVKAGESVSFNPGAPQGFRFLEWTAAKGTRKGTSTRVKTKKGDGELHVLVYYQRSSSGKYGYKITYTDIATNQTKTEKSAQEYISSAAAITKGENKAKALGLNDKKKYSNLSIEAYETGGLVDYTGLAMVHGSSSKPEAFLNAEQTAQIKDALMLQTKDGLLSSLQDSLLKFQSTIDGTVSGITSEANNSSINIQPGAVVIQVEELANNYDVEKLSNDVMNRMTAIAAKATNRGVNRR